MLEAVSAVKNASTACKGGIVPLRLAVEWLSHGARAQMEGLAMFGVICNLLRNLQTSGSPGAKKEANTAYPARLKVRIHLQ